MGATDLPALPPARTPLSARAFGDSVLIGEIIGRGGMSRVYRGWIRGSGREVAIKVLRDDLASRPDAVQRFVRERELLQTVASPHVVQVHDLVVHGDEFGIVMDLVPGGHLRRAVRFPCTLGVAAELAAQIAEGLAVVHRAGVVHRDLKPENVLVEQARDGRSLLRLTDFGISRLVDSAALTQTSVTGTPGYLAPEVAAGRRATAAADVYALGVTLYELCTGRQPFHGENPLLLVIAHTRQEPPRPVGMPDALWQVLATTLAKEPTARPAAAVLARDLRALVPRLEGLPPCQGAAPVPVGPDRAGPTSAAGPTPATVATPAAATPDISTGTTRGSERRPDSGRRPEAAHLVLGAPGSPVAPGGSRPGRHSPGHPGRERRPYPLTAVVGASLAAVLALVVGAVLAARLTGGSPSAVVSVGSRPAPTPTGPTGPTAGPVPGPPVTRTAATSPTQRPAVPTHSLSRPSGSALPDPAPTPSGRSVGPSPTASPGTPTLTTEAGTPQTRHSSDGRATLAIGNVTAGGGTIGRITVRWTADGESSGSQRIPVSDDPARTMYPTTVRGLTNGTEYTFTAEVCATSGICATSVPLTFTPYGAPTVTAPELRVVGAVVTVTVRPVARNANPGTTTCTLTLSGTPADPGAPTDQPVAADGTTLNYVGKASTSYVASETCTTDGIADGTATSAPGVTGSGVTSSP
ncbi:MAG TPA: protein kinase [Kineosporiaceae bacterium]